jgi:hypothetical protein
MTYRHNKVFAHEEMRLAELDFAGLLIDLHRSHHDKKYLAVRFELRSLVRAKRVFNREIVQLEFFLNLLQDVPAGVMKSDPYKAARLCQVVADRFYRDRRNPAPLRICSTVDDASMLELMA